MIVSFDLDETLFIDPKLEEAEPPLPGPLMLIYPNRLRKGTIALIRDLKARGHSVWVYTSSLRSVTYIKAIFWNYGIRFDNIINYQLHTESVQKDRKDLFPSKMPSHYRIGLHVDDEASVVRNGRLYGFNVIQVLRGDKQWAQKVLDEADRIERNEKNSRKKCEKEEEQHET